MEDFKNFKNGTFLAIGKWGKRASLGKKKKNESAAEGKGIKVRINR